MTNPVVRRRTPAGQSEGAELEEPLLGNDRADDGAHGGGASRGSRAEEAVVPYNTHVWADLLRTLVSGAASGLRTLRARLRGCVPWWRIKPKPSFSADQLAALDHLQHRISVPYDPEYSQHQAALRQLWDASFPGEHCTALKTERWKDMGWQGTDPATDFRGAGFLALECHLYMAYHHPEQFENLRYKRSGTRSEWEYPFAAGGVNLCFSLLELLDLRKADQVPRSTSGQAFVGLLGRGLSTGASGQRQGHSNGAAGDVSSLAPLPQQTEAFEELYCAAYAALDRHWLAARATYMEFPSVMRDTKVDVEAALAAANGSIERVGALLSEAQS